jgi:TonB family protein
MEKSIGITYGQEIRWTEPDGTVQTIEVSKCSTIEEAKREAVKAAQKWGWTPPKWWQWKRRNDTRIAA